MKCQNQFGNGWLCLSEWATEWKSGWVSEWMNWFDLHWVELNSRYEMKSNECMNEWKSMNLTELKRHDIRTEQRERWNDMTWNECMAWNGTKWGGVEWNEMNEIQRNDWHD